MADRGDTHYHVPHLNLWFLVSSLMFLATMVWTVIDDWNGEWKQYQRDFRALELAKSRTELAALEAEGAFDTEAELRARAEQAQSRLDEKVDEFAEAEREAYKRKEDRFKIEEEFKSEKSLLNWWIFLGEEEIQDDPELTVPQVEAEELAAQRGRVYALELRLEEATNLYEEQQAAVDTLRQELTEAEADLSAGTRELELVREKIDSLDPAALSKKTARVLRDFPGMDFVGPNMKISKQVLENLTFELNFTKKTRIDMCTTCHMGIDEEGFEEDPQPHTTHPRLDLYLTSKSPHPLKEVGCTICHRGAGEALAFQRSDHRPSDDDEEQAWHERHHWHKQHHWDYPMLSSGNIEASCVQCHQTSMDLIAADAPTVFRGYELFEAKGCYACHKVERFPVSRKPGPTLKNLAAKLGPEFVEAWVAHPLDFRPETHMPQFFHLENLPEDEVVVVSNFGQGREMLGGEWNRNAVAAITTFLFDNHPLQPLPPIPDEVKEGSDAERGREVMNLVGCFGCHNTAPWDSESYDGVPALSNRVTERNQMGPNLRGVATKLDETWLYNWIVDPTQYWPGTRMPNLRLPDRDVMDIVAYVVEDPDGIFHDAPPGWQETADPGAALDLEVLQEQARWYFQKEGRFKLVERFEGRDPENRWDDVRALAAAVGGKLVNNHGCFSCHEIAGMEDMMPIGTELTIWGTKTVDKLDFGLSHLMELEGRSGTSTGEPDVVPELSHEYREGWLERKLSRPRSYDLLKVKTPKDRLRMPWFGLDEEEVRAITTFVLGLVVDEVPRAKMQPTPEQLVMDAGMRAVRQNNCRACHAIEPSTITFETEDGSLVSIAGEVMPFFPEEPLPPRMDSLAAFEQDRLDAEEYNDEEIEEAYVRLTAIEPDFGLPNDRVAIPVDKLVAMTPTVGGDFVRHVTEYYRQGTYVRNPDYDPDDPDDDPFWRWTIGWDEDAEANLIEDVDGQQRPYADQEYDKLRWTFAPPVLLDEGSKIRADWFYAFLEDPISLRAQIRVRMPSFGFDTGEAGAIADQFAAKARLDWYPRYAKTLRMALGREIRPELLDGSTDHEWDLERQALTWPILGHVTSGTGLSFEELAERMASDPGNALEADTLRAIEAGYEPDIAASFGKLLAWGTAQGFVMAGPLKVGHELVEHRTPSYLSRRDAFRSLGQAVAADGVNCFQCHPDPDGSFRQEPIAYAPALELAHSRLREEWVWEWQWSPKFKYPGTTMPDNFATEQPGYQDQYPDSTNAEQIEGIIDWLYNMDRPLPR